MHRKRSVLQAALQNKGKSSHMVAVAAIRVKVDGEGGLS
jgi:hypothetical protein